MDVSIKSICSKLGGDLQRKPHTNKHTPQTFKKCSTMSTLSKRHKLLRFFLSFFLSLSLTCSQSLLSLNECDLIKKVKKEGKKIIPNSTDDPHYLAPLNRHNLRLKIKYRASHSSTECITYLNKLFTYETGWEFTKLLKANS